MPKVSVIIPAYNAMEFLPETLRSVLEQTFSDFEIVIVNDGSLDGIEQWVCALKDSRISLISTINRGAAAARNTGIEKSCGEYIAFLDADDLWAVTKLERQVECLDRRATVGLVYAWVEIVDRFGKSTGKLLSPNFEGEVLDRILRENFVICGSTPLVRRTCFENVGQFVSGLEPAEDWELWIRIATQYQFAVIKEPLVSYRQHAGNSSKGYEKMSDMSGVVIERAFQNLSSKDVNVRKEIVYGKIKLYLSWTALHQGNFSKAFQFWREAADCSIYVTFTLEYIRLSIALILVFLLGLDIYKLIVNLRRDAFGFFATKRGSPEASYKSHSSS